MSMYSGRPTSYPSASPRAIGLTLIRCQCCSNHASWNSWHWSDLSSPLIWEPSHAHVSDFLDSLTYQHAFCGGAWDDGWGRCQAHDVPCALVGQGLALRPSEPTR